MHNEDEEVSPHEVSTLPEDVAPATAEVASEQDKPVSDPVLGISGDIITEYQISRICGAKSNRMVLDVTRESQEISFQGLRLEAKYIDGLPAVIINHPGIAGGITVLASERPKARFVIEH